jgi:hypothetical protein
MSKTTKFNWTPEQVEEVSNFRAMGNSWKDILEVLIASGVPGATGLTVKKLRSCFSYWKADDFQAEEGDTASVVSMHTSRNNANLARRTTKKVVAALQAQDTLNDAVGKAISALPKIKGYKAKRPSKAKRQGTPAIAEILFSDYQIGKIGQHYNSEIAEESMARYSAAILQKMGDKSYSFEKIILASIGDIVEDHLKHGVGSAVSTDSGLSEQIAKATAHMWEYILKPLGDLGIPMEIICIAGNHGASQHKGMDSFKAGLFAYDYAIYKALEGYCKVAGYSHIEFYIPEGCFTYATIFDRTAIYEHGYTNNCTEASMDKKLKDRGNQMRVHGDYFRCGDMHHTCSFDNGRLVMNGAFFGTDTQGVEYSGILGFSAIPAQVMMIHTESNSVGRNTVTETINIQVAP